LSKVWTQPFTIHWFIKQQSIHRFARVKDWRIRADIRKIKYEDEDCYRLSNSDIPASCVNNGYFDNFLTRLIDLSSISILLQLNDESLDLHTKALGFNRIMNQPQSYYLKRQA